jgi:hypothetical protein
MQKIRQANQAQSVAPIPENLEDALNPQAPAEETPTEEPQPQPAQEEAPQLAEPEQPTETGENQ